jgi:flagellar hook-associated protein FlgK
VPTLSKAGKALKLGAEFTTYTSPMTSGRNVKVIAIGLAALLLLTGCGSKSPAKNTEAWTKKQQESISRMWLPARSTECQNFITIFQNFNTIINERFASSSQTGVAASVRDFKTFTKDSKLILEQMALISESKSIKEYSKKFTTWINELSNASQFTQEKAATLLTQGKELLYNPPYDCKNP